VISAFNTLPGELDALSILAGKYMYTQKKHTEVLLS
jgi:hypothetical protein